MIKKAWLFSRNRQIFNRDIPNDLFSQTGTKDFFAYVTTLHCFTRNLFLNIFEAA